MNPSWVSTLKGAWCTEHAKAWTPSSDPMVRGAMRELFRRILTLTLSQHRNDSVLFWERSRLGCCSARPRAERKHYGTHQTVCTPLPKRSTARRGLQHPGAGVLPVSTASFRQRERAGVRENSILKR
jgi:hypothetical protein